MEIVQNVDGVEEKGPHDRTQLKKNRNRIEQEEAEQQYKMSIVSKNENL